MCHLAHGGWSHPKDSYTFVAFMQEPGMPGVTLATDLGHLLIPRVQGVSVSESHVRVTFSVTSAGHSPKSMVEEICIQHNARYGLGEHIQYAWNRMLRGRHPATPSVRSDLISLARATDHFEANAFHPFTPLRHVGQPPNIDWSMFARGIDGHAIGSVCDGHMDWAIDSNVLVGTIPIECVPPEAFQLGTVCGNLDGRRVGCGSVRCGSIIEIDANLLYGELSNASLPAASVDGNCIAGTVHCSKIMPRLSRTTVDWPIQSMGGACDLGAIPHSIFKIRPGLDATNAFGALHDGSLEDRSITAIKFGNIDTALLRGCIDGGMFRDGTIGADAIGGRIDPNTVSGSYDSTQIQAGRLVSNAMRSNNCAATVVSLEGGHFVSWGSESMRACRFCARSTDARCSISRKILCRAMCGESLIAQRLDATSEITCIHCSVGAVDARRVVVDGRVDARYLDSPTVNALEELGVEGARFGTMLCHVLNNERLSARRGNAESLFCERVGSQMLGIGGTMCTPSALAYSAVFRSTSVPELKCGYVHVAAITARRARVRTAAATRLFSTRVVVGNGFGSVTTMRAVTGSTESYRTTAARLRTRDARVSRVELQGLTAASAHVDGLRCHRATVGGSTDCSRLGVLGHAATESSRHGDVSVGKYHAITLECKHISISGHSKSHRIGIGSITVVAVNASHVQASSSESTSYSTRQFLASHVRSTSVGVQSGRVATACSEKTFAKRVVANRGLAELSKRLNLLENRLMSIGS